MALPCVRLDTTILPVEEQFAGWARHSEQTALSPLSPGAFTAVGRFWSLGPVSLSAVRLDPFLSDRDAGHVERGGADFVQLVALTAGEVRYESEGIDHMVRAPGLFLRDYGRPSRATASRIDAIVLYCARSFVQRVAGPVEVHGPLPPSPEAEVLRAFVTMLPDALPGAEASSGELYARTLRDLLAAVLMRWAPAARGRAEEGTRGPDRWARARAYVAAQPPGRLSPTRMADDLGLSRSVLFALFRDHGGVLAYDRARRLRAVYQALLDPDERRPLAELAAGHGFGDGSTLAHAFRRHFGCPPGEVRARGALLPASGTDPATKVRALIAALS